jgi:transposase-like protein
MTCPRCGSFNNRQRGTRHGKQRVQCKDCGRYFRSEITFEKSDAEKFPAVLVFDIETLPIVAYTWGVYDTNIQTEGIIKDWCVLAWSAKWLNDDKVISDVLTSGEAKTRNDKRLVSGFWKLLDDADVVIGHNGRDFDIKKLNTRFMYNKINPPSSYKVIDTLISARSAFGMTFNKLDYLAQYLGMKRKKHTEFSLWVKCDQGDKTALSDMREYNERDVEVLEDVYMRIRQWMPNHPRFNVYEKVIGVCPVCFGEYNLIGLYQAAKQQYKEYRCTKCHSVFHSTKPEK